MPRPLMRPSKQLLLKLGVFLLLGMSTGFACCESTPMRTTSESDYLQGEIAKASLDLPCSTSGYSAKIVGLRIDGRDRVFIDVAVHGQTSELSEVMWLLAGTAIRDPDLVFAMHDEDEEPVAFRDPASHSSFPFETLHNLIKPLDDGCGVGIVPCLVQPQRGVKNEVYWVAFGEALPARLQRAGSLPIASLEVDRTPVACIPRRLEVVMD